MVRYKLAPATTPPTHHLPTEAIASPSQTRPDQTRPAKPRPAGPDLNLSPDDLHTNLHLDPTTYRDCFSGLFFFDRGASRRIAFDSSYQRRPPSPYFLPVKRFSSLGTRTRAEPPKPPTMSSNRNYDFLVCRKNPPTTFSFPPPPPSRYLPLSSRFASTSSMAVRMLPSLDRSRVGGATRRAHVHMPLLDL